ncbi:hypothetical protein PHISP_04870 [Aspergillus sp. HF37]|nr:hypothetical protein PHISP_04870 [Aspergillus sp. HF37]
MLEDEDFRLCLDVEEYVSKARREMGETRRHTHSEVTAAAEKRKMEDLEADGTLAEGVSAAKRIKISASDSAPVPGSGQQTRHLSPTAQETSIPSLSMTETTASTLTSTSTENTSSTSTNNTQKEAPSTTAQSDFPHAQTPQNTPFKTPAARTPRQSRIHFPIYEDPSERQDFFEEVYRCESMMYPSPSEDKENTDESFEVVDSDVDVEMDGATTEDEGEDGDEGMMDAEVESNNPGDGSRSRESTADPAPYVGPLRHSPWAANRGG